MATNVLADFVDVLNHKWFPLIHKQWKEEGAMAKNFGFQMGGGPDGAAWINQFSNGSASVVAEGATLLAGQLTNDIEVPALLSWGIYRAGFSLTDLAVSGFQTSDPVAMKNTIASRVAGTLRKINKAVNYDMINGTGTSGGNPNIVGLLGGALADTGTYATIDRAVYTEFAGNVLANGGNPRALTTDLLAQAEATIFERTGSSDYSNRIEIWTNAQVVRKYEQLFVNGTSTSPVVMVPQGMAYDLGAKTLTWHGYAIKKDNDIPEGTLMLLNREEIKLQQLAPPVLGVFAPVPAGQVANEVAGLYPYFWVPGKQASTSDVVMEVTVQMAVTRPNCMAIIEDIDES
jgi:hypothetical protein